MTSRLPLAFRLILAAAFGGLVAFLALRSSSFMQNLEWMPRFLARWADRHGVMRNVVAFFGLGLVVLTLFPPRLRLVLALCVFGTLLEVAQIWIPSRSFDPRDIYASIGGILLAWPFAWCLHRWLAK